MYSLLFTFAVLVLITAPLARAQGPPVTGTAIPGMVSFDRLITQLMAKWQVPGSVAAVANSGRLVLLRGYGRADVGLDQSIQPDSLFRIASLSKPITAAAILKLVEDGQLDLDAKAFTILDHLRPAGGTIADPRVSEITVRHLLQHAGGWDRTKSGDPTNGAPCDAIIRSVLSRPLDFAPGTDYAYSNVGYCVLGRIIEKVAGRSYEVYVKSQVLSQMGISRARIRRRDRDPAEVRYYLPADSPRCPPSGQGPCLYRDGSLENADSYAGWIASAPDLLRFVTALDGSRPPAFFKPETLRLMVSRPTIPRWAGSPGFYSLGWNVQPSGTDAVWSHEGSQPGSTALLVRAAQGRAWVVLFNLQPQDWRSFMREAGSALWNAAREVTEWPTHDLFGQFQ